MKTKTKGRGKVIEVCTAGPFQKTSRIELVSDSKSLDGIIHHSLPEIQPKHLDHYG